MKKQLYVSTCVSVALLTSLLSCSEKNDVSSESGLKDESAATLGNIDGPKDQSAVAPGDANGSKDESAAKLNDAELAVEYAKTALEQEDFANAKDYFISAINKTPSDCNLYKELYDNAKAYPALISNEELLAILKVGVYQVETKKIALMHEMISNVQVADDNMDEAAISSDSTPGSYDALIQRLSGELSLDMIYAEEDVQLALSKCEERRQILSDLVDFGVSVNDDEISKTIAAASYMELRAALKKMSQNLAISLKAPKETDIPLINAMVQTACGLVGQASCLDYSSLPETCRNEMSEFASHIQKSEIEFNKFKSKPALNQILGYTLSSYGSYTGRIDEAKRQLNCITGLLSKIYDDDSMNQAKDKIQAITDKIQQLTEQRYMTYQSWAMGNLSSVYSDYDKNRYVTNKDAISYISRISSIKVSLLSPEVLSLYQDVLNQFLGQLPADMRVEAEKTLTNATKRTLTYY